MDKIKFKVKEKSKVNFSMGMGIKEIYPPIEDLEVTPTKEQQIFTHENSYGYDNVTVNPIPDEYIIPDGTLDITENATYDVTPFSRVSARVYPAPTLQTKEVTPTKEMQVVGADEEYDGLDAVVVNPIPSEYIIPNLQDKTITINENGTKNIKADEGYDGLGSVEVITNVGGGNDELLTSFIATIDDSTGENITTIPSGITSIGANKYNGKTAMRLTELPDTIERIGSAAFNSCISIAITKLPQALTTIGDNAFNYCHSITELTVYEKVNNFPRYCFGQSRGLKKITFLSTSATFGAYCFFNSGALEAILLPNITAPPTISGSALGATKIANGQGFIYVPDNLVGACKTALSSITSNIKGISEYKG